MAPSEEAEKEEAAAAGDATVTKTYYVQGEGAGWAAGQLWGRVAHAHALRAARGMQRKPALCLLNPPLDSLPTLLAAAEPIDWDYTPLGKDGCSNESFA